MVIESMREGDSMVIIAASKSTVPPLYIRKWRAPKTVRLKKQ